jgi:TPP-dependent 2-oxoacid decarboxylase
LKALVDVCGYPVTVLNDGKGFFPETHPCFTGCFFRGFSNPISIKDMVDASDALLLLGT